MNTPFSPFPDPPFGPGSRGGCDDRHDAARGDRRRGRREMRAAFREHVRDGFDPRQGGFGPGFGPRGLGLGGFGPGGFGPGFGPGSGGFGPGFGPGGFGRGGQRGGHRGGQRGGRSRRGDVRAAILALLAERPMHGYEMIQQIEERSQGLWKPSPGSVYPTLQLLVDEGLLVARDADGAKKLFELTEDGRAAAEKIATPPWETIAEDADPAALKLRAALGALMGAVAQSAHAATAEQQQRIVDIVDGARREVYQILGESSSTTQD